MKKKSKISHYIPLGYLQFSFYFLTVFCPSVIIITILILGIYSMEVYNSERSSLSTEQHITTHASDTITDFFNVAINDVTYLATQNEIKNYFTDHEKDEFQELTAELLSYCGLKPLCYSVRIIDTDGKELVKVQRHGDYVRLVSAGELQNKKERYYFKEVMGIGRGEVYVSPMDLNIEYGKIEEPLQPVVRFGMPLFDNNDIKSGVIVINMLGEEVLKKLKTAPGDGNTQHMIFNMDGYWLLGGAHGDDFAFMFEEKKAVKLGNLYPDMWKDISGNTSGHGHVHSSVENDNENYSGMDSLTYSSSEKPKGQYTFLTIYNTGRHFIHDKFISKDHFREPQQRPSKELVGEPYWKIVSFIPHEAVVGGHKTRYKRLYGGLAALLILLSLLYAKYMLNQLEAAVRKNESDERLMAQERQFRILHKNAFDGIVIADKDGVIIESNTSVENIFGYEEGELVGKSISVLIPEKHREAHKKGFRNFINTGKEHVLNQVLELEGISKSDEVFPIELVLSRISIDGSLLITGTIRDVSEKKKSEETIEKLAYYDQLTNLPNRALFIDRLNQSLARANRYNTNLGLLFMDFDHFKNLNDTLGHIVGDKFLQAAAKRLEAFSRSSDSVARLGGDEFVIFVADQDDISGIMVVAGKIATIFKEPFEIEGHEFFMTASIGVSVYPDDGKDVMTLMKNADTAMYKAKAEGGGSFHLYTPSMNEKALERLELENKLRRALEREEFYLDYQPQVDPESYKVIGVEALLRWRSKELGLISPAEFIPVAETTRLIVSIGEWALREACEEMVRLHQQGLDGLSIAVNVSLYQIKDAGFLDTLDKILDETGLEARYLELEITESVAMDNVEESIKMLNELKSRGIRLSIDDFGTGYSSLEHLKRMPIDVLKIDISFIRNITENNDDKNIVETIVKIAHSFNCKVVAEGVETPEQLSVLKTFRCDIIQGYLFSKPVAPEELKREYVNAISLYGQNSSKKAAINKK